MDDMQKTQETIAHLVKTVDDLSDIVADHQKQIALMAARITMLMQREAEREADTGGAYPVADAKPPHW
jgi:SlyX protein